MKSLPSKSLLFSFAAISTVAFSAACAAPTAPTDESVAAESEALSVVPVIIDFCATQAPDSILYVPSAFGVPHQEVSQTGFYGYGRLCPKWILDIKLAGYSNATFDAATGVYTPRPLTVAAGAYDLPSSSAAGGSKATNAEDCGRHVETTSVYLQDYNASAFTLLYTRKWAGTWSNGVCSYSGTSGAPLLLQQPPLNSGWRTYRVVSSTKLRTSYQETSVTLAEQAAH